MIPLQKGCQTRFWHSTCNDKALIPWNMFVMIYYYSFGRVILTVRLEPAYQTFKIIQLLYFPTLQSVPRSADLNVSMSLLQMRASISIMFSKSVRATFAASSTSGFQTLTTEGSWLWARWQEKIWSLWLLCKWYGDFPFDPVMGLPI